MKKGESKPSLFLFQEIVGTFLRTLIFLVLKPKRFAYLEKVGDTKKDKAVSYPRRSPAQLYHNPIIEQQVNSV